MFVERLLPSFRPDLVQISLVGAAAATSERQAERAGSGAAAGLVPLQTSRIDNQANRRPQRENDSFDISFEKRCRAEKRVKRLKRSVWASGHLHGIANHGHRAPVCHFVTLTYAEANAWRPDHISAATAAFRRYCKRKGVPCRYTWVAEIQPKRLERAGESVVHYHLLAWLPRGVRMPFWDKPTTSRGRTVAPFWNHGMSNTQQAKSGVGYLMKYLSKLGELTIFPDGLRLYGVGGLNEEARAVRCWYNLPEWVKNLYGVGQVKRKRSRLIELETGEIIESLYRIQLIPGGLRLYLKRDYPERPENQVGAYSSLKGH